MKEKIKCWFGFHDYEIIHEHQIKSQIEILAEKGLDSLTCFSNMFLISKYVIIYKCKNCKKIKETIITNEPQ